MGGIFIKRGKRLDAQFLGNTLKGKTILNDWQPNKI